MHRFFYLTPLFLFVSVPVLAQAPPQPTVEHQQLAREAGVWDAQCQCWMTSPTDEPMLSTGTETCTMLGGFWLLSEFEGEFGGMPFSGRGHTGFDPKSSEYTSTWIDSMTPHPFHSRGTYDVATHTLTLVGEAPDMMSGETQQMKMVIHYVDDDHKEFTMYEAPLGSDAWKKTMRIDYTRRK